MRIMLHAIIVAGCLLATACTDPVQVPDQPKMTLLYSTSFESAADTAGWRGYAFELYDEGAPGGGARSLAVSGHDVFPQAAKDLAANAKDARLVIRFWARLLPQNMGPAGMSVGDGIGAPVVSRSVEDTLWTAYTVEASFRAGVRPALDLWAGGLATATALFDKIEVYRVDVP